jgi:fructokinase
MFLCCGDALFDLFVAPSPDPAEIRIEGRAGGSPMNVAIGLARLGARSAYFTKLSRDVFGERLHATLVREGVETWAIRRSDAHSTLAVVALDRAGAASYSFYVEGTADTVLEPADLPALGPETGVVHVASYSTVVEPSGATLARFVADERNRRVISYDPNIRDSIEPDLDRWRMRAGVFSAAAHLIKVSEDDLAKLYPGRSREAVAEDWLGAGARLVVVTRGGQGAEAYSSQGAVARHPGQPVTVVDTVGAGDTFQAATLRWLERHGRLSPESLGALVAVELHALLGYAARAAAITCSRRGADLPRAAELGE